MVVFQGGDLLDGFHDAVRVQGHGVDAVLDEEFGEGWLVAGSLPADAYFNAGSVGGFDQLLDGFENGRVHFIEAGAQFFGVP